MADEQPANEKTNSTMSNVTLTAPAPTKVEVTEESEQPEAKTFTQAEVDAIVKKRAERVAADKFKDYGDLQQKAKEFDKLQEANATELERATKKAREEGSTEARQKANTLLISAEARALAAEARFRNPRLAVKAIDLNGVNVAEDGTVDGDAIRSLLDDLAKEEPYLIDTGEKPKPKPDVAQGQHKGNSASAAEPGLARLREAYATKS